MNKLKKKKKIIFFPFFGDSVGGSHFSTFLLIKNLERINYSYLIIIMREGVLEEYLKKNNFKYIKLQVKFDPNINNPIKLLINVLRNLIEVHKLFKIYKPYLVHTNDIKMH